MKNSQKGFIIPLVIAVVAVLIIGGGATYYYTKTKNKEVKNEQIAGWKTYTNVEYGFEFKYPQKLFDDELPPTQDSCTSSSQKPRAQLFGGFYDTGTDQNSMLVYVLCDPSISRDPTNKEIVITTLGGLKAEQYSYINDNTERGIGGHQVNKITVVPFGTYSLEIIFSSGYGISERPKIVDGTMDQILSTFKFTKTAVENQTTDWKTYTSAKYGFQFNYPNTLEVIDNVFTSVSPIGYSGGGYQFRIESDVKESYLDFKKRSHVTSENDSMIGSVSVKKLLVGSDTGATITYLYFSHDNKNFRISYFGNEAEQERILSTFRFTSPTQSTSNWKTYINTQFGFQFNYPKGLTGLQEYPLSQNCKRDDTVGKGTYGIPPTVASISNVEVNVFCLPLKNGGSDSVSLIEKVAPTTITVAGRVAYQYEFVTATGYLWRVVQIPNPDNTKYIEITYTYGNSYRLNNEGYELNATEWANILSSFTFTLN